MITEFRYGSRWNEKEKVWEVMEYPPFSGNTPVVIATCLLKYNAEGIAEALQDLWTLGRLMRT